MLAEELVAANLMQRSDPVMFAHSIIREATYHLLQAEERLTLHAQAARILADGGAESEVVAEHLLLAAAGEESVGSACIARDAGRAAARKGVHSAALRYLRHALRVAPIDRIPPRLLIDLGLSEAAAGEVMSLHRFEQALNLMDDPAERADALYSLGETLYRFGRFAEAGATFFVVALRCLMPGNATFECDSKVPRGVQESSSRGRRRACRWRRSAATALITAWF